jgi:hypothetical protein
MSIYVLSDNHINALLTYAIAHRISLPVRDADGSIRTALDLSKSADQQKAADILHTQNVRSVCFNYPEDNADEYGLITFKRYWHNGIAGQCISGVQVIKACECYDYQSCETDDYEQTTAKLIIASISRHAISELPGYEEAEWSID